MSEAPEQPGRPVAVARRAARALAGLPVVGPGVRRAASYARGAALSAAPMPVRARDAYVRAITGGPLDLSPASVGPPGHDDAATPAVEALTARGGDPAARLERLRGIRDDLVRTHATPYELVHAVLEAEAAVALEAVRAGAGASAGGRGSRGDGPVVIDARSWPSDAAADPLPLLRAVRAVAGDREVVALLGDADAVTAKSVADGALADASLVDRLEVLPDRLVGIHPSGFVALDVLGAPAPAAARFAALRGCASIGVVHDLTRWERPRDAADWLRLHSRAALLHDLDLVLAGDATVAAELTRWLGVPAGRIAVLGGRTPEPRSEVSLGDHVRTVHCLASARTVDDVACVVTAAAIATAGDHVPRRVLVHGEVPPGAGPRLDDLCRALGRHTPVVEVLADAAPAPAARDVVVDASHDGRHVAAAVALAAGAVPVIAVRAPASVEVLGDGPWLVAPRDPAAVAGLLGSWADVPGGAGGVATGQLSRAGEAAAGRAATLAGTVRRTVESVAGDAAADTAAPPTTVALCSLSGGALLDLLLAKAAGTRPDVALVGVETESLSGALARPVAALDASILVRPQPVDVLVAVTDSRVDLVGLAVAEAYGVPVVTAESALFAVHIDTRGPHATVPLVATEAAEPTPHELVVLRLSGARPAATGMADLSRRVRALLVTSDETCAQVRAEGGEAETVGLPARPPASEHTAPTRDDARDEIGLDPDAFVVSCLARAGDYSRTADRVVAAVGWLALWGRPATILLPSWLPPAERDRLAVLAGQLGCPRPPVHVDAVGERGVNLLVAAGDVVVHLGSDASGPEELWTIGARRVTTVVPAGGDVPAVRVVPPSITPLQLAEELLSTVGVVTGPVELPGSQGLALQGTGEWAARLWARVEESA